MMKPLICLLLSATLAVVQLFAVVQPLVASPVSGSAIPEAALRSPADQSRSAIPSADTIAVVETIRAGEPMFSSDFDDESDPWRIESDDDIAMFYADGAYHMRVMDSDSGDLSSAGISVADFYVQVDATQIAGSPDAWFGLFFRAEADDYGYLFTVNGDGAYQLLWVQEDSEPADIVAETLTADLNTGSGTTNRLGVLARGSQLVLIANDVVLAEIQDRGSAEGDIALVALTQDEPGLEVAFDSLRVWDLSNYSDTELEIAETPAPPTPVEEATEVPPPPAPVEETTEIPVEEVAETPVPPTPVAEIATTGVIIDPLFDSAAMLAAIRSEEPLFEDTFLRDRGQWTVGSDEGIERFYEDKAYHIAVTGADHTGWATAGFAAGDFMAEVLSAQVESSPGSYVGLLFRYVDNANFYAYLVNREGEFLLQKWVSGEPETLVGWQDSDVIDDVTAENLLGVVVAGPRIVLLANDEPLAFVLDETFTTGDVALVAGTVEGEGMEASFDDLLLWNSAPASDLLDLLEGSAPISEEDTGPEFDLAMLETIHLEEPVVSESFTRDRGVWNTETSEAAERYIEDRAYHIHMVKPSSISWTSAELSLSDLLAEVRTSHVAGPLAGEAGLLFRVQDEENFYRFATTGEGTYVLDKLVGGVWETLVGPTEADVLATGEGASNLLGVLMRASTIVLLANGEVLAIVEDSTFAEGDVAMVAGTFTDPDVVVAFDDLEIWDLTPLQDVLPAVDVTPAPEPAAGAFDPVVLDAIRAIEPVIDEDFTRDRGDWDTTTTDEYGAFFLERTYHMQLANPETIYWSYADVDLSDILVETDMTFLTGNGGTSGGLLLCHADSDNAYLFTIQADGDYLFENKVDGDWQTLIAETRSDAIVAGEGATNRLSVYANGPLFAFAVNDTLLTTLEDNTHARGDVALTVVSGAEGGAEVAFDDLLIWDLGPLAGQLPHGSVAPTPEETPEPPEEVALEPTGEATAIPEFTPEPAEETTAVPEVAPEPTPEAVEPDTTLEYIESIRARVPIATIDSDADEYVFQDMEEFSGELWWFDWDFAYRDGAYHFNNWTPGVTAAALTEILAGDFYMEVDTELIYDDPTGSPFGVMFRWNGDWYDGTGYLFEIDGAGQCALFDEFGDAIQSCASSQSITTGEGSQNRLGVLAEGESIVLLANDTVVAEIQDDRYTEGYIGLYVYLSVLAENEVDFAFSNLAVWDLD